MAEPYESLRNVPLFSGMPDEDLKRIFEFANVVRLSPGDVLFSEGQPGDAAYVIKAGTVEVVKISAGREVLLALRKPGDVIGEVALLEETPRMATARSKEGAELIAIPRAGFRRLLETSASAARALYFTIIERLRATEIMLRQSEKLAQLGTLSAGVAHELNNPAAAVKRGSEQLRAEIEKYSDAIRQVERAHLAAPARDALTRELHLAMSERGSPPVVDALARSDREAENETWLGGAKVERAWELAPALAEAGFDRARLEALEAAVAREAIGPAVRLLVATHTIHSLLREVSEGAGRISEIVGALKSYTYLDQAPVQDVDVHEGLESTLVIMRSRLKGIEVRREYSQDIGRVSAYGSELNQVWTNLIDNAADAMGPRGTLTLRTRREGDFAVVEVEDDGPGIPAEIQGRIFDPFFTTKPPGKGTGLGLDISQRIIVNRHRGEIKVFSQPGRTCFRVWLPVRRDVHAPALVATSRATDDELRAILRDSKVVAVVGISDDPVKPAGHVPAYLQSHGYRIVPVNPKLSEVLGERAYPDLKSVPGRVDVVQVFRRSEAVGPIVDEAIAVGAKVVWMQSGILNEEAADRARRAGLKVVMDTCMMATHRSLVGEGAQGT